MSVTDTPPRDRREGLQKLLRSGAMFANLILWPFYADAMQPWIVEHGYTLEAVKYAGMSATVVTCLGWLHSVKAGIVTQLIALGAVAVLVIS